MYMNKKIIIILITLLISALFSCNKNNGNSSIGSLEPYIHPGDSLGAADNPSTVNGSLNFDKMPESLIKINPEFETLVAVYDANLDADSIEEQIIAVNEKDNPDANISIKVIKFKKVLNRNAFVWDAQTKSANITDFQINVYDITGDGRNEIICEGVAANGSFAYDIFKVVRGSAYLSYRNIFSITTKGTMDIQEFQRSEAYHSGLSFNESFKIVVTEPDERGGNEYDLKETTYNWRAESGSYKAANTRRIAGEKIEDAELRKVLVAGGDKLKEFLENGWRKRNSDIIMFIDSSQKTISFFKSDSIVTFTWKNFSHSSSYAINKIKLNKSFNNLIKNLLVNFEIRIKSLNELVLTIEDRQDRSESSVINEYSGTYEKLNPNIELSYITDLRTPPLVEMPILTGFYTSDTGIDITFEPPFFTMVDKNIEKNRNGGFAVYNVGYNVLDLSFFSIGNKIIAKETYNFEYKEEQRLGEIIRTLYLKPGTVGVYNFQLDDTVTLKFEQIELIDAE